MHFNELLAVLDDEGLDTRRSVSLVNANEFADPEVSFNIVRRGSTVRVLAGVGRGLLAEVPYDGYEFASEEAACDFVWRRIRTIARPALVSDEERLLNREEAEAAVARRAGNNDDRR